jgi:hypothetical protein
MSERDDDRLDAEITELEVPGEGEEEEVQPHDTVEEHLADDLAAGQGSADETTTIPAEDLMELAGIRDAGDQGTAVASADDLDRLGQMTHVGVYEGELEARAPDSDQPDDSDVENIESLLELELREGETDNPDEAAEEGLTWVPPTDPPVVPGDLGQPVVAAGFGTTADDEPFDADHHGSPVSGEDERTERVREALVAHASTSGLVDRLRFDTIGTGIIVEGTVDDLSDEEAVLEVLSGIDGVTEVVNRIEIQGLG